MNIYAAFEARLGQALADLVAEGKLAALPDLSRVVVEPTRDPAHGDIATNAALVLAKDVGLNPRTLAELIAERLGRLDEVEAASGAGPGFINMRLAPKLWTQVLASILATGGAYGRSDRGRGEPVDVEYVSANPTGPMHVGHCRGAVVGDALASLLEQAGYRVTREYY